MIPNCESTTDINTCTSCKSGYVLIRYSNCFSQNISNCPMGSLPRNVNGVSFCQQFDVLNCNNTSPDGLYCIQCNQGFTSINGRCFIVSNTINCPSGSCNCQGGYYFGDNCYMTQISNCLKTSDNIYCDLCNDLFYASRGVCTKFIKNSDINCNVLAADGITCAGCVLNYFLNSDFICTKTFQLCLNGCTSCPVGFELYNSNCYYNDPLCLYYNFTLNACQLCAEGYFLNSRTTCSKEIVCLSRDSNNVCNKCFTGYQLDYTTFQCVQLPNNCATMNTSLASCTACSQGTTFWKQQLICVFQTANCISYDSFGYCQTCGSGFVLVSRTCLVQASNCLVLQASDNSQCSVCMNGYRLSGSQCSLII